MSFIEVRSFILRAVNVFIYNTQAHWARKQEDFHLSSKTPTPPGGVSQPHRGFPELLSSVPHS